MICNLYTPQGGGTAGKIIAAVPMFRFDSQYVFLTYPHSEFVHSAYHEFLNGVCPVDWCRIATEKHADGDPHVHVIAKFVRRFQCRNERVFDFESRHPNVQPVRSVSAAIKYVGKDGQFTDYGTLPEETKKRSAKEAFALAGSHDEAEYLIACQAAGVSYQYAKRMRELAFSDSTNVITEDYVPNLEWECQRLRDLALPENSCPVLVGPSGIGKTAWATRVAPKPCLWVSHLDVLRLFKPSYHKSIVFDDMSFTHMPLQAQIHLLDWDRPRQIHCRYGYASIPAGTIKIFTCNDDPFTVHPAINRRTTYIRL